MPCDPQMTRVTPKLTFRSVCLGLLEMKAGRAKSAEGSQVWEDRGDRKETSEFKQIMGKAKVVGSLLVSCLFGYSVCSCVCSLCSHTVDKQQGKLPECGVSLRSQKLCSEKHL